MVSTYYKGLMAQYNRVHKPHSTKAEDAEASGFDVPITFYHKAMARASEHKQLTHTHAQCAMLNVLALFGRDTGKRVEKCLTPLNRADYPAVRATVHDTLKQLGFKVATVQPACDQVAQETLTEAITSKKPMIIAEHGTRTLSGRNLNHSDQATPTNGHVYLVYPDKTGGWVVADSIDRVPAPLSEEALRLKLWDRHTQISIIEAQPAPDVVVYSMMFHHNHQACYHPGLCAKRRANLKPRLDDDLYEKTQAV
ncbi:MAG: hypothetical protein KC476_04605 [Cyanobacteria bacterium HKST-UBA06]|nr:hypothetical protein [Cyanobacteria bacterium HKST-UBA06]MCA9842852.1 hypothetical protein [Cyanobacteria bacterium HKST-UBA03]